MLPERRIQLTTKLRALIAGNTQTLADTISRVDYQQYLSEEIAEQEYRTVFTAYPQLGCASAHLASPGDYVLRSLNGRPVIIVRTDTGEVRACLNQCRHRGAPLVTEEYGHARTFICPYHHWTWKLTGQLISPGRPACFNGLEAEETLLIPVAVQEKGGFVWIAEHSQALTDRTLPSGLFNELNEYVFSSFRHFGGFTLHKKMNWKLAVDTFFESWHFTALHRTTISDYFFSGTGSLVEAERHCLRLVYPRKSFRNFRGDERQTLLRHVLIIYFIFPSTLIHWQKDHLETWQFFPGAHPGECTARFELYTPEVVTERTRALWQKNVEIQRQTVDDEDFALMERVRSNMAAHPDGHLIFGRNEPALSLFHRSLSEVMLSPE